MAPIFSGLTTAQTLWNEPYWFGLSREKTTGSVTMQTVSSQWMEDALTEDHEM